MKTIGLFLLLFSCCQLGFSQVSGNANYQNSNYLPDYTINIPPPASSDILLEVKGLSNLKADAYVAIFSVTQVGKMADEVNRLMDERINAVEKAAVAKANVTCFVDMISFVPEYEYEIEKKIFSNKTYNEIPKGFELKKNLHIQYKNPEILQELIALCASYEIYDLVRVDYTSVNMEQQKKELRSKAKTLLDEKIKYYQEVLGIDLNVLEKNISDGFRVVYPIEMYKSYQAFSSAAVDAKKSSKVYTADKSTTQYYQPIIDKEFDFVLNPIVVEPVIQLMYEVNVRIKREKPVVQEIKKEYLLITPTGEIKKLEID